VKPDVATTEHAKHHFDLIDGNVNVYVPTCHAGMEKYWTKHSASVSVQRRRVLITTGMIHGHVTVNVKQKNAVLQRYLTKPRVPADVQIVHVLREEN